MIRILILLLLLSDILGCSSVTMRPEEGKEVNYPPSYDKSHDYYVLWLIGEARVDVKKICGTNKVTQIQTVFTPKDFAIMAITFGLYTPHTVRVWCKTGRV